MDARRALPFLLLAIGVIGITAAVITNGRGGPNDIRRIRRISLNEYLVPPPPPPFHSPSRTGRLTNPETTQPPGYFQQLMSWLDPFGLVSSPSSPSPSQQQPLSPPPLSLPEIPYAASSQIIQHPVPPPRSHENYNDPSLAAYDKPPLPPPVYDDHSTGYRSTVYERIRNCNPCNKVPWMPIRHDETFNSADATLPVQPSHLSSGNNYPPQANYEAPHDVHHAATHEIRNPDYSLVSHPGDKSYVGSMPNSQMYTGTLSPIFKGESFRGDFASIVPDGNPGYHGAQLSSIPSGDVSTVNEPFLGAADAGHNVGYNEQSVYQNPSGHPSDVGVVRQQVGYPGPFQGHVGHDDLSSSGSQVTHGHVDPALNQQVFKDIPIHQGSYGSINDQTPFDGIVNSDHSSSAVSNNRGYVTTLNGSRGGFRNSSQIDQGPSGNFEITDLNRITNGFEQRYNDLSSSGNVAKESYAPSRSTDETSTKHGDSIHFEESLLLDFTHKGESRPVSSSIPPTSNAFASAFESAESSATTLAPGDEILGTFQQGAATTKSHSSVNYFHADPATASDDDDATQNGSHRDYIVRWQNVDPKDTDKERQQGAKRNKQVQVIIPYTSQYTPVPFQSTREQNTSYTDNYVGEESKSQIKVVNLSNSSHTFESWRNILPISENVMKKPINIKMNNSIDVHRLQKNIDNWTIQEYSKAITASTEPPGESSANPYLFRSKQIPDEYLTTTEPINAPASYDNVKTFTLGGFSFNDVEYKESASDRVEGSRVPVIRIGSTKSPESSTDAPTEGDVTWHDFPIDIDPVNKGRIYVVTPQSVTTTPKSNPVERKREKAMTAAERDPMESRRTAEMETETKSNKFESIEKVYQVLPQAVNNLAVASTGPENVLLWGIMEHDDFASSADSEQDYETPKIMLHAGHSKVSRGRR